MVKTLVISLFCLNVLQLYAQEDHQQLLLEIELPTDTFRIHKSFPVYITLYNLNSKPVWVPKNVDFISNLWPNGHLEQWDGALLELQIDEHSGFGSIIEENIIWVEEVEFVKIKPKSSIKQLVVDLSHHFKLYQHSIDSEELRVQTGKEYKLTFTYTNERVYPKRKTGTFKGLIVSGQFKVWVKN